MTPTDLISLNGHQNLSMKKNITKLKPSFPIKNKANQEKDNPKNINI